jgi:hypothetical protein
MLEAAAERLLAANTSSGELDSKLQALRVAAVLTAAVAATGGRPAKAAEVAERLPQIRHMPIGGAVTKEFVVLFLGHMIKTGETLPDWFELFEVSQIFDSLDCLEYNAREAMRRWSRSTESGADLRLQTANITLGSVTRIRELVEMDATRGALAEALVLLAHSSSESVMAGYLVRRGGRKGRAAKSRDSAAEADTLLSDVKAFRAKHRRKGRRAIAEALFDRHGDWDIEDPEDSRARALSRLAKRIERAEKKQA